LNGTPDFMENLCDFVHRTKTNLQQIQEQALVVTYSTKISKEENTKKSKN